jgi:glucosamine--fructose-6-phosphate aminotransferase (isomerizing)
MDHGRTAGQHTLSEIRSQPQAWAAVAPAAQSSETAWRSFFAGQDGTQNLLFGCGSTYYLSLTAASVLQAVTGVTSRAVPSSELLFYDRAWIASGPSIRGLAISRSGTTTETLRALEALSKQKDCHLAAVTCYSGTPMETWCSPALVSPEGHETSIAQTRSFASMLVGCLAIAGIVGRRAALIEGLTALPPLGQHLLADYEGLAESLGGDVRLERVFFLGSGSRYGLACEGMLKMKEMSLTSSEAYHFLEFRHGPKSMVDSSTLVVGLLSDAARAAEKQVLREMKELGATLLVLAESAEGLEWADHVVCFRSGLPEAARLPLYLPVLQLLAYYRAVSKGLNPDAPRNLDAVVKLGDS